MKKSSFDSENDSFFDSEQNESQRPLKTSTNDVKKVKENNTKLNIKQDWLDDEMSDSEDDDFDIDAEFDKNYSLAHLKKEDFNKTGEFSYLLEEESKDNKNGELYTPMAPPKMKKIEKPSFFDLSKDLSLPILFEDDEEEDKPQRGRNGKKEVKSRMRRGKKKQGTRKIPLGFGLNEDNLNPENKKKKAHFERKRGTKIQKNSKNENSLLSVLSGFTTKGHKTGTLSKEERRQMKNVKNFKKSPRRGKTPKTGKRGKTPKIGKRGKRGKVMKTSDSSQNSTLKSPGRIKRMNTFRKKGKTPKLTKQGTKEQSGMFGDGFKLFRKKDKNEKFLKAPEPILPEAVENELTQKLSKRGGGSFRMTKDGEGNLSFQNLDFGLDFEEIDFNPKGPPPPPPRSKPIADDPNLKHVKRENIKNKSSSVPNELSYNAVHRSPKAFERPENEKSRSGTM